MSSLLGHVPLCDRFTPMSRRREIGYLTLAVAWYIDRDALTREEVR